MRRLAIAGAAAAGISLLFVSTALAAFSLFGEASVVSPGNNSPNAVKLTSDAAPGYAGIAFSVAPGTTFGSLSELSTDVRAETDDVCVGGSPRFQIRVPEMGPLEPGDTSGDNIFVYMNCTAVWSNTGDLLSPGMTVDTSQVGGTFYHEYSAAVAAFGTLPVSGLSLAVDSGWAAPDGEQTFFIDNTNVDGTVYTYDQPADKDQCKNGGWQDLTRADGSRFRNQGDCVSYFNTGR